MAVQNEDVAEILDRVATLLEIDGENPFRTRAYRNAAYVLEGLSRPVSEMLQKGEDLSKYQGIGKDLAGKIAEIVQTGHLPLLDDLEQKIPPTLIPLTQLPGLGPKKVAQLHKELGINSLTDLENAAKKGRIAGAKGFAKKTEQKILEKIPEFKQQAAAQRMPWPIADSVAKDIVKYLKELPSVDKIEVAGSYRRKKETVGDLDILVISRNNKSVMDKFVRYDRVGEVLSKGTTRSSIILKNGLQIDLRIVEEKSFGSALLYFTGSKEHNIEVRKLGLARHLKLNEYGLFHGEKIVAGKTEKTVYEKVGLSYIEPEIRENRGEIEAAKKGKLPKLVTVEDILGDLHAYTNVTDGKNSLEEMAEAARAKGYSYLAITDHSKRVTRAGGLDEKALAKHIEAIDRLNDRMKGFRILKGIEVDILDDGSLDLPDSILSKLDLRVCSVHYNQDMPKEKMTERILKAMDNPNFNILGHPTGRVLGRRDPYAVDLERVMEAAAERGCFVEVNAQPKRLDISDIYCKLARDTGVKVAISTDSHTTGSLDTMHLGVNQARRGWLTAADVINTRPWSALKRLLKR